MSLALQCIHNPKLMFRRNPGINSSGRNRIHQFSLVHFCQLGAGYHAVIIRDTQFFGNVQGCQRVVTCDHHRAYACRKRFIHGIIHFGTGRVDHTDQADKYQVFLDRHPVIMGVTVRAELDCKPEHAHTIHGNLGVSLLDAFAPILTHGFNAVFSPDPVRDLKQSVHCTFGYGDELPAGIRAAGIPEGLEALIQLTSLKCMDGRHPFSVRIKRKLRYPGEGLLKFVFEKSCLGSSNHQGAFGRVTHRAEGSRVISFFFQNGIITNAAPDQQDGFSAALHKAGLVAF